MKYKKKKSFSFLLNSTETSPLDTTHINYTDDVPIILFKNTTTNFRDLTPHNNKRNGPIENNDLILYGIPVGVFIVLCIFCAIGIYYSKGETYPLISLRNEFQCLNFLFCFFFGGGLLFVSFYFFFKQILCNIQYV